MSRKPGYRTLSKPAGIDPTTAPSRFYQTPEATRTGYLGRWSSAPLGGALPSAAPRRERRAAGGGGVARS